MASNCMRGMRSRAYKFENTPINHAHKREPTLAALRERGEMNKLFERFKHLLFENVEPAMPSAAYLMRLPRHRHHDD